MNRLILLIAGSIAGLCPAVVFATAQWPRVSWPDWAPVRDEESLAQDHGWLEKEKDASRQGAYHRVIYDTFIDLTHDAVEHAFYREVIHYHNEQGVDLAGDLSVTYVPAEEALFLIHLRRRVAGGGGWEEIPYHVQVEREGKVEGMYVDERTVAFIPEKITARDTVDFAYLRVRRRPPGGGWDWLESDDHGFHVSSRRLVVRCRRDHELRQHARGLAKAVVLTNADDTFRVYEWSRDHIDPPAQETRIPRSYDPVSYLLLSEVRSWGELVESYASKLEDIPPSDEVSQLALRLAQGSADDVIAKLAGWVQQNIRYVGIEIAVHRMIPAAPADTLRRGWGDCKDMSLLLVQMLRAAGKKAWPVLVRSQDLGPIDPNLPSLSFFNHEIVAVETPAGLLFVDPTMKEAVPPWSGAVWPGQNLLVVSESHGFHTVQSQPDALDEVAVRIEARLRGEPGQRQILTMKANTSYKGPALYSMRRRILEGRPERLRAEAARFFGKSTGGLVLTAMEHDYSGAARAVSPLVIRETLTFSGRDKARRCPLQYLPPEVGEWFDLPSVAGRLSPFGLDHPRTTQVELRMGSRSSGGDLVTSDDWSYGDRFVKMSRRVEKGASGLVASWSFETLSDVVPVRDYPSFAAAMEAARTSAELLVCRGEASKKSSGEGRGSLVLAWLLGFFASAVIFYGLGRRSLRQ